MSYPILKKSYLDSQMTARIEAKLERLNKLRPLPAPLVKKIHDHFKIEMTYNSNGIEGNSLTCKETYLVINEGITIKGKPLKDHLEATNHYEALNYLSDLVQKDKKHTFSEVLIIQLHRMILQHIEREWGGRYRNSQVLIGGSSHKPPPSKLVPHEMQRLVNWVIDHRNTHQVIELAAIIHHRLVFIHPFFDGNGRTARLVMNTLLMQNGYPLVSVLKNDRKKYYRTLSLADHGDIKPFVRFIAQCVERSLDLYLKAIMPDTIKQEKHLLLSQIAKQTRFSAKYLNLLIRKGKLEAHKEGRNWKTSIDAVKRYLNARKRKS
ncbi:MAG: Fic family protein [Deltaproteobacteria bacterium]|nr:Fic family protein [Deltaproteobacteria bacterium]